ncbi:Bug family tripartite tricarboxylate transporter substrate binding protein [Saccharopolyspora endophytica]|uniref:Tripartite tricarboxylate transporter substrate binding protein n=1 Tax=Saccharopolyspora endophytica TaxID=543886 RepID=A0ABS5DBY3_9PSEU|nr:tripartite tricarboxylate transporter substrate binding protein [Saccharopolyspora endophytica]MBQ0923677.1 tripartite tricarboxylate transporter substrate binding protein [Saccharopolyspora endophytica]
MRHSPTKVIPWVVAVLLTGAVVAAAPAEQRHGSPVAQVLGDRQLRLMAPAAPGGGWDQTAREMQSSLQDSVGRTEVYNVTGAGGTIGLSQFVRYRGDPAQLMATGLIMVGAVKANDSPVSLDDTTPLIRLTTDAEVIAVPQDSPIRSLSDLTTRMRGDLRGVSIAGGSAGGAEHILAGMLAQAVGADPAQLSYVAHSGGGELLSTALSGRATVAISGVSELEPQITSGQMRALAVSSAQRAPTLPDVPTLTERGLDVELDNWRGVVAPKGISAEQERALEQALLEMTRSPKWRETLAEEGWGDATLGGPEFETFLRAEQDRVSDVLGKIGLG